MTIQGNLLWRRGTPPRRMRAKADFWLGIALCVGAIWIVVGAGNQWSGHLVGGGLALVGVAVALRNVRA